MIWYEIWMIYLQVLKIEIVNDEQQIRQVIWVELQEAAIYPCQMVLK